MAKGRRRGAKHFQAKAARKPRKHVKDLHRAAVPGRAAQGMGRAGRSGGTKSAGGHGVPVQGGVRAADRGGRAIGGTRIDRGGHSTEGDRRRLAREAGRLGSGSRVDEAQATRRPRARTGS